MCEREDSARSLLVPISGRLYRGPSPLILLPLSLVFFRLTCYIPASLPLANRAPAHDTSAHGRQRIEGVWTCQERYAASASVTREKPLVEHRTADRRPHEDLGTSVGLRKKGRQLASRVIALAAETPLTPPYMVACKPTIVTASAIPARL
jgi:hypothetical protein